MTGAGIGSGQSAGGGSATRLSGSSDRPLRGGVVRQSGLAYLHAGESVHARGDAEAEIDLLARDIGADVTVTLPVIVHVAAVADDDARHDEVADLVLRRLRHALESQRLA